MGNNWQQLSDTTGLIGTPDSDQCSLIYDSYSNSPILAAINGDFNLSAIGYSNNQWSYLAGIISLGSVGFYGQLSPLLENQSNHHLGIAYYGNNGIKWEAFNGSSWSEIAGPATSASSYQYPIDAALNPQNGAPYLAYFTPNNDSLTVYQYLSATTMKRVGK